MKKMRILAVGAHPDDLELLCGGTLARYARLGHKVVMAHLLNGDKGHYTMESTRLALIRRREALQAARVIGAESVALDVPDGQLFSNLETRIAVMDLIRSARPDLILTHYPRDYMSDHTATARLVCDASFLAAAPLFKTARKAHSKTPPIYFMDTLAGIDFPALEYVDITAAFPAKLKMLQQHRSQLVWLKAHDGVDVLRDMETVARFRGLQCGVKYAECFCRYAAWGRIAPRRLLP